ncbi:MAG: hypothetical protein LBS09_02875 [Bacteroidales bacterium]|jgi:hypothetical protein|nr:hypothetical protein [Bacteroidales bacterium]
MDGSNEKEQGKLKKSRVETDIDALRAYASEEFENMRASKSDERRQYFFDRYKEWQDKINALSNTSEL